MCYVRHKYITIMSVYHLDLLCLCFIVNHWAPGSMAWPCGYNGENCPTDGVYAPNPADCTQYYWCIHNRWTPFNCSNLFPGSCGAPVMYCKRVTCPETTSSTTSTISSSVFLMTRTVEAIHTNRSSPKYQHTFSSRITTNGVTSDTAAVTFTEPNSTTEPRSGSVSGSSHTCTPGAIAAGTVTSVALAMLNIIQCVLLVIFWRRIKHTERSDQSIQAVAKEQPRTTDLTSNGYPGANTAASRSNGDNYMFLVKSEYIDGSAMSGGNEDRNGYQELSAAETPSSDEYSYAYTSAGGRKTSVKPGEHDKKHKSDVYELQHMYSN